MTADPVGLSDIAARLGATEDMVMVGRIADLTQQIEVMDRQRDQIARERAGIIQILRADGWSLGRIATATGLSRARVQQIAGPTPTG